jgi:hypothetical protein
MMMFSFNLNYLNIRICNIKRVCKFNNESLFFKLKVDNDNFFFRMLKKKI